MRLENKATTYIQHKKAAFYLEELDFMRTCSVSVFSVTLPKILYRSVNSSESDQTLLLR